MRQPQRPARAEPLHCAQFQYPCVFHAVMSMFAVHHFPLCFGPQVLRPRVSYRARFEQ